MFNLILPVFGPMALLYGNPQDALFLGIILANAGIGITQEMRDKRALDRLSLPVAPRPMVKRNQAIRHFPLEEVVVDYLVLLQPGDLCGFPRMRPGCWDTSINA
jgi:cation-transporting P-type ATPase E